MKHEQIGVYNLEHFQLNDTAVELFFADGTTRLFSFGDRKKRNGFLRKLGDSLPPSLVRHEVIVIKITNLYISMEHCS